MPTEQHQHPGGNVPHRHNDQDELAVHDSTHVERAGESTDTMRLREEELNARKTSVETGRVRVGKDVVSEERTLEVPVTHEEVTIERRPVGRQPADGPIGEGEQTISVPVHEEQVRLEKQSVVYEEIGVGKQAVQETKQVSGTVRREEARIEGADTTETRRGA